MMPRPSASISSARESPPGGNDGQRRPQVVEDAGAERERGLDVVEVGADPDVGLQQVVLALVVVDPALVEEDVGAGEAQLVGRAPGSATAIRMLGDVGVGVAEPRKKSRTLGTPLAQPVDGPEQGEGVEPVVDPPPQRITLSSGRSRGPRP